MKHDSLISEGFSGVISFLSGGKPHAQHSYGYADLANLRENTIDTKFAAATAGKTFVACAVMKLIEDGRLSFDSQIGRILDMHLGRIDRSVTIKELLTHTSGIPDYFYNTEMGNYKELFRDIPNYKIRRPKDLLPLFINKPMNYNTYGKFLYIYSGYTLLALAIEAVTRKPFEQYIEKAVFEPCEMINTGYFPLDRPPANTAFNYLYDDEKEEYYLNIYSTEVVGTGAGGVFTTAPDIENFWRGLAEGVFLSRKTFDTMISPQIAEGYYGYGFWIREGNPIMQGGEPGISFISVFDIKKDNIITIISNYGNNVWSLMDDILTDEFY